MNSQALQGVYRVQKRWQLVCLSNKAENVQFAMDYFKFEKMLLQRFTVTQIKKILDEINCDRSLIIDFTNSIVKVVVEKEQPYIKAMTGYFSTAQAAAGNEEEEPLFL